MKPLPLVDTPPPLISIRDITVVRGRQTVLSGFSAEIVRGRITAVVGLNGSGKSTLLRTLLSELPYTGEILYRCGHDHSKPKPEYVGYVPQRISFDTHLPMTVRDLIGIALNGSRPAFFGLRQRLKKRLKQILEPVKATELLDVPVDGLSGGQLQRVLLALALEPHPELLLLDEPAAGIDFHSEEEFYQLIAELNNTTGVTVLLVSHDVASIRKYAHHVLCVRGGKVHAQGNPKEIMTTEILAETFGSPAHLLLNR